MPERDAAVSPRSERTQNAILLVRLRLTLPAVYYKYGLDTRSVDNEISAK